MFKILNKTGFYLNARRLMVNIYKGKSPDKRYYRTTCDNVSLSLAIRICKIYGVNLQRLAKKYYKRENQEQGWLDVVQRLKIADKIEIADAETYEVLLIIIGNHRKID